MNFEDASIQINERLGETPDLPNESENDVNIVFTGGWGKSIKKPGADSFYVVGIKGGDKGFAKGTSVSFIPSISTTIPDAGQNASILFGQSTELWKDYINFEEGPEVSNEVDETITEEDLYIEKDDPDNPEKFYVLKVYMIVKDIPFKNPKRKDIITWVKENSLEFSEAIVTDRIYKLATNTQEYDNFGIPRSPNFSRTLFSFVCNWPPASSLLSHVLGSFEQFHRLHFERQMGPIFKFHKVGKPVIPRYPQKREQVDAYSTNFVGNISTYKARMGCTLMEYAGKTLQTVYLPKRIADEAGLPEKKRGLLLKQNMRWLSNEIKSITFQAIHSLAIMASFGMIHADIKLDNILVIGLTIHHKTSMVSEDMRDFANNKKLPLYMLRFPDGSIGPSGTTKLLINPYEYGSVPRPPQTHSFYKVLKLIDFGHHRDRAETAYTTNFRKNPLQESLYQYNDPVYPDAYLPPEVLEDTEFISGAYHTSDMYVLGLMLMALGLGVETIDLYRFVYGTRLYPKGTKYRKAPLIRPYFYATDLLLLALENNTTEEVVRKEKEKLWAGIQGMNIDRKDHLAFVVNRDRRGEENEKKRTDRLWSLFGLEGIKMLISMMAYDPKRRRLARDVLIEQCTRTGYFGKFLVKDHAEYYDRLYDDSAPNHHKGLYDLTLDYPRIYSQNDMKHLDNVEEFTL